MDWARLDALLDELLELPVAERSGRLQALERSEPALARRLREALDPSTAVPGLEQRLGALVEAAAEVEAPEDAASPPAGIGPWRPVERIGQGGMGEVWLVRRADGEYETTAALKRLRSGELSIGARTRFVRERQLLADLRHPHIATLLDGGVDSRGVPYFVMEYVDGEPITEHCDRRRASVAQRIALFAQVTDAVAVAHQRLVVHRDLKPANILVSAAGAVKLLDFGIAKLLDEPLESDLTRTVDRVATPRYAAPEQLAGGAVTTATDVYALGVVLYELLSGLPPFSDAERRATLPVPASLADPPPMSVALGRLETSAAAELAARRGLAAREHRRRLAGDLDAIVAKALRPEPAQRYATVASLAEDLRREAAALPVEAHRGSRIYRARKFWARHRLMVSAAAAVGVALTLGLSVALVQGRAARLAERRQAAINRFLTDELLGSADPRVARGRDLTVREVVEDADRRVGSALGHEPAIEASVRRTLGTVAARLGEVATARQQLEAARALVASGAGGRLERARLARSFAELALAEGVFERAQEEIRAALEGLSESQGADPRERLEARILAGRIAAANGDVVRAEQDLRTLVAELDARADALPELAAAARVELAAALKSEGRRDEALSVLQQAADLQERTLGANHPDVAQTLEQEAHIYAWIGRSAEAEAAARRALSIDLDVYGPAHWRSVRGANYLAEVLARAGRGEEARGEAERALAGARALGDEHPQVAVLRNTLATLATEAGEYTKAELEYRRALAGAEGANGAGSELAQMIRRNFSNFLARHGDAREALALARRVRALGLEAAEGAEPDAMALANVAWFLATAELPEARDLETALALAGRAVERSHGRTYYPWVALSEARYRRGDLDGAIAAEQRAVALPDGLHLAGETRYLVRLMTERGDLAGAEHFLREQVERVRAALPDRDPLLGHTRALLGRVLLEEGRPAEATGELRAALALYESRLPPEHEWRIPVLADLGGALAAAGDRDGARIALVEAERLARNWRSERAAEERRRIAERLAALDASRGVSAPAEPARDGGGAKPSP